MEMVLQPASGTAEQMRPARISVDRYHRMIEQGILSSDDRIELLDGYLVEKMSKNPDHVIISRRMFKRLLRILPDGWAVATQDPITLEQSSPEPDIVVFRGKDEDYNRRHPGVGEIALVVEVADSSLDRDRIWKQDIYARAGLPVYWLVNLQNRTIEVFARPVNGAYTEKRVVGAFESLALAEPAILLTPADIWG